MSMRTVHFIGGEKGGVGKSWVARTMVQYFLDGGNPEVDPSVPLLDEEQLVQTQGTNSSLPGPSTLPFVAVDCDRSNPTLSNVYRDWTEQVVFSEHPDLEDLADEIFELALEKSVVVNLPAQVHRPLRDWMLNKKITAMGQANNIQFVHWFVCDGEDDSINLVIQSLQELGDQLPHVLIKNHGRCDDWTYFDEHQVSSRALEQAKQAGREEPLNVHQALQRYQVPVIEFPKLSTLKRIPLNAHRMTFDQARRYKAFGILGRNQIVMYLREAYSAFEETGYLGEKKAPLAPTESSAKSTSGKSTRKAKAKPTPQPPESADALADSPA
jgi:hypothetical protein